MPDGRWERVEELCHEALARDPGERDAFLREACGGDDELRAEVVSLVANESDADALMKTGGSGLASENTPLDLLGTRVGRYEVVATIGAGGMGEVYRARDTDLRRDVALKVLPAVFRTDRDRLSRLQREARTLASISHPHIAAIYGIEEAAGIHALVLELVEGETLADRIARGPIPVAEAVKLIRQIADALHAAHELGIVHRDLKPANIKVSPEGAVKVLDFGLARSVGPRREVDASASSLEGAIQGTAAYMSPEQARGQAVDRRTDVWAVGCVLFEMLTGTSAFAGATVSDTIARVLERDPDWRALPSGTPSTVSVCLARCLTKDPAERVHDLADLRLALDGAFEVRAPGGEAARLPLPTAVAAAAAILATLGAAAWHFAPSTGGRPAAVRRFAFTAAPAELDITHTGRDLAITPDGTKLVYFAYRGSQRQLYIRPLDAVEGTAIRQAELFGEPFVSPDGNWVGVIDIASGAILKIPVAGGPPVQIAPPGVDHTTFAGASWGTDNSIVFSRGRGGLWRVASEGGTPMQLTTPNEGIGELSHAWPDVLPGGKAVLFTSMSSSGFQTKSLSLVTGEQKVLVPGGSGARFSSTGHLLYGAGETNALRAVPFDPSRLVVTGAPVPVLPDVMGKLGGVVNFSVAADGTIAYVPGRRLLTASRSPADPTIGGNTAELAAGLFWFDRSGAPGARLPVTQHCRNPTLSPDERLVAVECYDADRLRDVWTVDLERGVSERLTSEPTGEADPVWSQDGRALFYSSVSSGPRSVVFRAQVGTSGTHDRLFESDGALYTHSLSPDGRHLLIVVGPTLDIVELPLNEEGPLKPVIQTPFQELEPQFSPDGKYVSYSSNESGRLEVYIQPYPTTGQRWKVSVEGGTDATWRRDGRELFYVRPDRTLMAMPVTLSPTLELGTPQVLFRAPIAGPLGGGHRFPYAATRDGQRFLMYVEEPASAPPSIIVLVNWMSELGQ